ncbi:MAG: hypothetical protein JXA54_11955 [Candidatus Heimdallarchaeota archaeon]|nr:hypothetical protein [Candidatus Heimdallarchaeota archaeon]
MSEKDKINDAYKNFAKGLSEIEEEDKKKRKEVLKDGIMDLEQKYKEEIKGTHAVDVRLVKLRKEAGMPELIGIGEKVDRNRFKNKDKFDQFLAKEVLEVGLEGSSKFGGILIFKEFCKVFTNERPNWIASEKDIKQALETLAISGLIPKMYKMKNKSILITFKPAELESDHLTILSIASVKGFTTQDEVAKLTGWSKERLELNFVSLIDQEMAFYDKKDQKYYFAVLKS